MTELVRISRGLWRPKSTVDGVAARAAALLSVLPDGTIIAGDTAARLHGLWLPDRPCPRIDFILRAGVKVPEKYPGSRRREVRGRRRAVGRDERCTVEGLPLTTIARTWVDLAESLSMPDLIAAGDSALRRGCTVAELTEAVRAASHRRGVVRARAALPLLDQRSESRPESHLRYALVASGLPAPQVNVPIYSSVGEWLAQPDLSYKDVRLALEYNGNDHADVARMRRDITRELDVAKRGGWRTLTFGPVQVFRRPDQIGSLVREVRQRRTAGLD